MLSSITPLGERGRNRRWGTTAAFYVLGSVAGGATIGAVLSVVGMPLARELADRGAVAAGVVAVLCVTAAVLDVGRRRLPLPTIQRQVNEDWLDAYRGWFVGLGFGFQLGLGVVTIVTTATVYLWLSLALLSGSVWHGLVIGVTFGLARAVPIVATRSATDPARLAAVHRRLHQWRWGARRAVAGLTGLVAVSVLVLESVA